MDDPRFRKLPKWAQEDIATLRRKVDDLTRELKAQQCDEPSRIFWGRRYMGPSANGYLGNDEHIEFVPKSDGYERPIRIHFNQELTCLECHCDGQIVVRSTSRNWVQISVEP